MTIKFINEKHKTFFDEKVKEYRIENDRYRLAAIYVLGLSENCRKNFSDCYDGRYCDKKAITKEWVTHADAKVIRFAFGLYGARIYTAYLYNDYESKYWEAEKYNPAYLFDCQYATYFFEAIKILHWYYFDNEDSENEV